MGVSAIRNFHLGEPVVRIAAKPLGIAARSKVLDECLDDNALVDAPRHRGTEVRLWGLKLCDYFRAACADAGAGG